MVDYDYKYVGGYAMTPANEGIYEFKNDNLVEIRRLMGISQSKMAEELGIPANTLSRWETGATSPDAKALAAIYSKAKEYGVSSIPPFFGVRRASTELKLSSKPTDQSINALFYYQFLQGFLNTRIELTGTELAPIIEVEINNTAPIEPAWPKIVFTGVGISLAETNAEQRSIRHDKIRKRRSEVTANRDDKLVETPWQNDSKRQDLLKTHFNRLDSGDFPDITPDENSHGDALFPGQSVIYEIDITNELLPYLQFKVEGTVSRRHLFHYVETFTMPEHITKPTVIAAFRDFKTIDIYGPLELVIKSMPKFDSGTRLEEVQSFSKMISDSISKNKMNQEEIKKTWARHYYRWFRAQLRAAFIFLDRVNAGLVRMQDAIGSSSPDKIAAEISSIFALKGEATLLDGETKDLMQKHNISGEDIKLT